MIVIYSIRYSCRILMEFIYLDWFFEKHSNTKFRGNPSNGSRFLAWGSADVQTGGWVDIHDRSWWSLLAILRTLLEGVKSTSPGGNRTENQIRRSVSWKKAHLTFSRRIFFLNFSTPCIWNVNNTGTKYVRIMKQTAVWRGKKRRVYTVFKMFGTYIC